MAMVLCVQGSLWPWFYVAQDEQIDPLCRRTYVSRILCDQCPMRPRLYVAKALCVQGYVFTGSCLHCRLCVPLSNLLLICNTSLIEYAFIATYPSKSRFITSEDKNYGYHPYQDKYVQILKTHQPPDAQIFRCAVTHPGQRLFRFI